MSYQQSEIYRDQKAEEKLMEDQSRMPLSSPDEVLDVLDVTAKGGVCQTISNCVTILRKDPRLSGVFRWNLMDGRVDVSDSVPWSRRGSGAITDTDENQLRLYMESNYEIRSKDAIRAAVDIVANENRYHPVQEFLKSLKWDGQPRIAHLLTRFLGADEGWYTEEIMRLVMVAAIARVFHPGCKFETMPVLIGDQGAGKSTFFRFLACKDEWFSDDLRKLDDDNIYRRLQGHWIIEMSEMTATSNTKSIEETKSFLSRMKDTYKVPYATYPEDRPRQCIFVGTSNNLDCLPLDRTGNRRFAPIEIDPKEAEAHILDDEEEARAYIVQAWAEAMEFYRSHPKFRLAPTKRFADEVTRIQSDYMPEDVDEEIILDWLDTCGKDYVCTRMIYREAMKQGDGEPSPREIKIINRIMNTKAKGWERISSTHRFDRDGYKIQRGWARITSPDGFHKPSEEEEKEIPFR